MADFKNYNTRKHEVKARQIDDQTEIVACYNNTVVAVEGDYVVIDPMGRTVVMKKERFENRYKEVDSEPNIERVSYTHSIL